MSSERIDQIFQRRPPTANLLQITKKGLKMKLVRKLLCFKKNHRCNLVILYWSQEKNTLI